MSIRHHFSIFIIAIIAIALHSCANIVKPGGGPRDEEGPMIEEIQPPHQTINFQEKQVVIFFNEYIKPGSYDKEIFISPIPSIMPEVIVVGKKLIIRFRDELQANTTYVLNLGKNIKDANEGNPMKEPTVYAFSTGSMLDSISFSGTVYDPWTGQGSKAFTLLLFSADSINDSNNIFDRVPQYAAMTNETGAFNFNYLKSNRYKIFGVNDLDNSYSYNQSKESIAIMENPLVDATDTLMAEKAFRLIAFVKDTEPPAIKFAKWVNDTVVHLAFKEPVRESYDDRQLQIYFRDTLGNNSIPVAVYENVFNNNTEFLIRSELPRFSSPVLFFENLMDTLGNGIDTSYFLSATSESSLSKTKGIFLPPVIDTVYQTIVLQSLHPMKIFQDSGVVVLSDTSGNPIEAEVKYTGFSVYIKPITLPPNIPLYININVGLQLEDTLLDTLQKVMISFPNPADFGALSGKIVRSSEQDSGKKYILLLYSAGRNSRIVRRTEGKDEFNFTNLPAGKYTILLFHDEDGNGYWTPGNLAENKLPEKIILNPAEIDIRGKWTIEDYEVHTLPKKVEASEGTGKGKK